MIQKLSGGGCNIRFRIEICNCCFRTILHRIYPAPCFQSWLSLVFLLWKSPPGRRQVMDTCFIPFTLVLFQYSIVQVLSGNLYESRVSYGLAVLMVSSSQVCCEHFRGSFQHFFGSMNQPIHEISFILELHTRLIVFCTKCHSSFLLPSRGFSKFYFLFFFCVFLLPFSQREGSTLLQLLCLSQKWKSHMFLRFMYIDLVHSS